MGSFIREKQKKIGFVWSLCRVPECPFGQPEQQVRRVPRPGTRRTDHCSSCATEKTHGEPKHFAVCQSPRHTAKSCAAGPRLTKFVVCLSRWHTAKWEISPCAYFLAHGEVFCHVVRPSSRCQCLFLPCTLGYTRRMCLPCAR